MEGFGHIKAATGHRETFCIRAMVEGGIREGGKEAAMVKVGGSKQRMVAECCPLLCSSDKDRLAPQVSSARGSQARGQGRCMNRPAYKHLIITQAEEAL